MDSKNVVSFVRGAWGRLGLVAVGAVAPVMAFAQTSGTTVDPSAVTAAISGNNGTLMTIGAAVLVAVAILACIKLAKRAV